jgi:hypothetical protein
VFLRDGDIVLADGEVETVVLKLAKLKPAPPAIRTACWPRWPRLGAGRDAGPDRRGLAQLRSERKKPACYAPTNVVLAAGPDMLSVPACARRRGLKH